MHRFFRHSSALLLAFFAATSASQLVAATIDFSGLPGAHGAVVTSYSQAGYQVSGISGVWREAQTFGNPVPSVFTQSATASLEVQRVGGGGFNFASVDLVNANRITGQFDYQITGYAASNPVFTFSGSYASNFFATVANSTYGTVIVDRLVMEFTSTTTSFNIDDIVLNDVELADLSITKSAGVTSVVAGGSVTYTITASNAGPSNASGAIVADTFPAVLTGTWTCVAAGGGTCTASGSGNINDTVNLPAGGSVTYTVSATVSPAATGTLSNTATVTAPAGVTDPALDNNSATASNALAAPVVNPVPSLSAWALLLLSLGLLAVGRSTWQRREG